MSLRQEMSKTQKKIYVASSNVTSTSRLFKSVGDFSHCKKVFGKANHALHFAAEEINFTAFPFGEVNYFCINGVDLAKDVLKTS